MKYDVTYSCGHEETVQLFGKMKDRYSRIKWMEGELCPECAAKRNRERRIKEEKEMGLVLKYQFDIEQKCMMLIAYGDTMSNKELLKSLGFKYSYVYRNELTINKCTYLPCGEKLWNIKWGLEENFRAITQQALAMVEKVKEQVPSVTFLKMAYWEGEYAVQAQKKLMAQKQKNDALREKINNLIAPQKPEWLTGRWNGRVYGSEKYGHRVYLDNQETFISKEQKEEIESYQKALDEYEKEIKKIKNDNA